MTNKAQNSNRETKSQEHPENQYLSLINEILQNGDRKVDRGTGDASYSLFGKQMRFDLSAGFPLLTTKKVYWKGVLYELFWFLHGHTNIKYLVDNKVHIWDDYPYKIYLEKFRSSKSEIRSKSKYTNSNNTNKLSKEEFIEKIATDTEFAKKWGELPKIYGQMWRAWPTKESGRTVDQVKWVIDELKADPNAHNLIVNSWNPEYLYTMAKLKEASRFPICHNMYQINLLDGKLYLQLYQRSADLFLGVPFNIASYALLTHILAHVTGYEVGEFVHTFGDVHIYEMHLGQVKEQLRRKPLKFPKIKINSKSKNIDKLQPKDIELIDYKFHPPIKAPLSVSGGYYNKS